MTRLTSVLATFGSIMLLACVPVVCAGQDAGPSSPSAAIAQAKQLLSSLSNTAPTSRYAEVGREYGLVVDGVRQAAATMAQLNEMRDITSNLRKRTTERLKAAEAEAGENEGALEGLYR